MGLQIEDFSRPQTGQLQTYKVFLIQVRKPTSIYLMLLLRTTAHEQLRMKTCGAWSRTAKSCITSQQTAYGLCVQELCATSLDKALKDGALHAGSCLQEVGESSSIDVGSMHGVMVRC